MARTLIVANRLPVTFRIRDGRPHVLPSTGGLATGLQGFHEREDSLWIGWPDDLSRLGAHQQEAMRTMLAARRLVPVPLTHAEITAYYENFSNGVLWPLFHYQLDRVPLDARDWKTYQAVNQRFADAVVNSYSDGDLVWIHDYQLMLVPAMVRQRIPEATIGFFLHIPFPSFEVFRTLPWRRELLEGLLGADLIGFHTFPYVRYFAHAVFQILGLEATVDRIDTDGREVRIGAFPLGVDADRFEALAADGQVCADLEAIRAGAHDRRLILGIDRLDYTKGIPRRLLAFERLLERRPKLANQLRLIQVAVPSRAAAEQYRAFRRQLEEMVGRINGRFGTTESAPIHYLYRSVPAHQLVALYRAADIMLVTALRDGMNLVAKEFVASRTDEDGVLVLSEFAGAADELGEALRINPYDIDAVADTITRALDMPRDERQTRMRALRQRVRTRSSVRWSDGFLSALRRQRPHAPAAAPTPVPEPSELMDRLNAVHNPVLLLGYDGTLVPLASIPQFARPDAALIHLLRTVGPIQPIHIISGRSKENLEAWFGELPVSLWAEHGAWHRPAPGAPWQLELQVSTTWLPGIRVLLDEFAACTPGALVEEKGTSIAWHYRTTDPEFGQQQARELRLLLMDALRGEPADVLRGSKVIEVRPSGIHKGRVVEHILRSMQDASRIIAIGDDRTDEDMFAALPVDAITVHVGAGPSRAAYRLPDSDAVRSLLLTTSAAAHEGDHYPSPVRVGQ